MNVLMLPAGQDRAANPYTYLLSENLKADGLDVRSMATLHEACSQHDILHVHWPHNYAARPSFLRSLIDGTALIILCLYQKALGAKVVWSVHDLHSFSRPHKKLENTVMRAFTQMLDGLIFLNPATPELLFAQRNYLRNLPCVMTPIGLLSTEYPPLMQKGKARLLAQLPEDKWLIVIPGDIKPYKNIEGLLRKLVKNPGENTLILLAGRCDPPEYESAITETIKQTRAAGLEIDWRNGRPTDYELGLLIDAADEVGLSYKTSWNSAMAILALERQRPILCSGESSFGELSKELGSYWISSESRMPARFVSDEFVMPTQDDWNALTEFKKKRNWPLISTLTKSLYVKLTSRNT